MGLLICNIYLVNPVLFALADGNLSINSLPVFKGRHRLPDPPPNAGVPRPNLCRRRQRTGPDLVGLSDHHHSSRRYPAEFLHWPKVRSHDFTCPHVELGVVQLGRENGCNNSVIPLVQNDFRFSAAWLLLGHIRNPVDVMSVQSVIMKCKVCQEDYQWVNFWSKFTCIFSVWDVVHLLL